MFYDLLIYIFMKFVTFLLLMIMTNYMDFAESSKCISFIPDGLNKHFICVNNENYLDALPTNIPKDVYLINVSNQRIKAINSKYLRNLNKLSNLTLSKNGIEYIISNSFQFIPQLKVLILSENFLYLNNSSLPRTCWLHLQQLEHLDLSNNPLGFVSDYYFQALKSLKVLILSGAKIGFFVENNGFYHLKKLEYLDLSNNHLKTLSGGLLPSLSNMSLTRFYLIDNPWNCDCNLQWLKVWFSKRSNIEFVTVINKQEIQPQCQEPVIYRNRNFLSNSHNELSLRATDFKCKPKIFTTSRMMTIKSGQNVTLTCDFEANPGGRVTWSKNGMIVQKHWQKVTWGQSQGIRFQAWLKLENVHLSDEGRWKCILTTNVGKASSNFDLKVINGISNVNLKSVLKYVGIGAITLILLLVVVGIIIYCVYGFQIQRSHGPIIPSAHLGQNSNLNASSNSLRRSLSNGHQAVDKTNYVYAWTQDNNNNNSINKKDNVTYRIISIPNKSQNDSSNLLIQQKPLTSSNIVQPCLDQSHSPYSHYILQDSSQSNLPFSFCPLHGQSKLTGISKPQNISQPDLTMKLPKTTPGTIDPCPLHGNILLSLPTDSTNSNIDENSNSNYIYHVNNSHLTSPVHHPISTSHIIASTSSHPLVILSPSSTEQISHPILPLTHSNPYNNTLSNNLNSNVSNNDNFQSIPTSNFSPLTSSVSYNSVSNKDTYVASI